MKKSGFLRTADEKLVAEGRSEDKTEMLADEIHGILEKYEAAEAPRQEEESYDVDLTDLERDAELTRADRETGAAVEAAEAEVENARDAYDALVKGVLEELKDVPLGDKLRGVLENSAEAKRIQEAKAKLEKARQDRQAARDKVWEKYPLKEGEEIEVTADMLEAVEDLPEPKEEVIEVTDDMIEQIEDLTPAQKKEAETVVRKNELPPTRQAELKQEIQKMENSLYDIRHGAVIIDRETGGSVEKPGLIELEKKLATFGVNTEYLSKKAVSGWERLKFGLRTLTDPELNRTIKQYEERFQEWNAADFNLKKAREELADPRKYANLAQYRLSRTLAARNSQRGRSGSPGGLLTMKF